MAAISPWLPEQNRHRLAALGKLAEECNELAGRANRCIIQGLEEIDPKSGLTNFAELEAEIADVRAAIALIVERLDLDPPARRSAEKLAGYHHWHRLIATAEAGNR
jgi:hypothetical protein